MPLYTWSDQFHTLTVGTKLRKHTTHQLFAKVDDLNVLDDRGEIGSIKGLIVPLEDLFDVFEVKIV